MLPLAQTIIHSSIKIANTKWGSRLFGNRLAILAYHRIEDDPIDPLSVSPNVFQMQMQWLAKSGYHTLSLTEALKRLEQRTSLHRSLVITFDDGYTSVLKHASPVLEAYGFNATIFLVTNKLGRRSDWHRTSPSADLLSSEQICMLQYRGHTLGSHTLNHPMLTHLSTDDLEHELRQSRQFLEERYGLSEVFFAYPYGIFGQRERLAVIQSGYKAACGVGGFWGNGYETDRFSLHRFEMHRQYALRDFQSIVASTVRLPLVIWPWQRLKRMRNDSP